MRRANATHRSIELNYVMTLQYEAAVLYEPGKPLVIEYAEAAPLGSSDVYLDKGPHALPFDDRERRAVPVVLPAAERPPRSSGRQRR
jgi:hypothetical protein